MNSLIIDFVFAVTAVIVLFIAYNKILKKYDQIEKRDITNGIKKSLKTNLNLLFFVMVLLFFGMMSGPTLLLSTIVVAGLMIYYPYKKMYEYFFQSVSVKSFQSVLAYVVGFAGFSVIAYAVLSTAQSVFIAFANDASLEAAYIYVEGFDLVVYVINVIMAFLSDFFLTVGIGFYFFSSKETKQQVIFKAILAVFVINLLVVNWIMQVVVTGVIIYFVTKVVIPKSKLILESYPVE